MDHPALKAHVEEICASAAFARAQRATRLLQYLSDAFGSGRATSIKEFDLGLDVFDRGPDYDPKADSIVRTEVTRLRARLERYYATEGTAAPLRLSIPRGSYELQVMEAPGTPVLVPGARSSFRKPALAVAAAVALLAAAGTASFRPKPPQEHIDLRKLTSGDHSDRNPVVSRNGDLIAYGSDRAGEGRLDIWLQHTKGGEPIRLTSGPFDASLPHFSPDGSLVAYRSEGPTPGVYVVPVLGGPARLVAAHGNRPRFSNDGRFIAYEVSARGGGSKAAVWIVPVEGGTSRELKAGFQPAMHPLWSPDDRHILVWGGQPVDWWAVPISGGGAVRTNAYRFLQQQGLSFGPATDWLDGDLYFRAGRGDAANVHSARIALRTFQLEGPVTRITFGSGYETSASVTRDRRVAFLSNAIKAPILAGSASGAGAPVPLPGDGAEAGASGLSVSADGRRMAYVVNAAEGEVRLLEVGSGKNRLIARAPQVGWVAALHPAGDLVAYTLGGQPGTVVVRRTDGSVLRECERCGEPQRFTPGGDALLLRRGNELRWLDWGSGKSRTLLSGALSSTGLASVSPDARHVAFAITSDPGLTSIYLAPIHPERATARDEWIALPDSRSDSNPVWSPDGRWLYFLSERDAGRRCVWRVPLRRVSTPAGPAEPVVHFHDHRLHASYGWPLTNGLAVAGDRVFLRARSETGSVWISR